MASKSNNIIPGKIHHNTGDPKKEDIHHDTNSNNTLHFRSIQAPYSIRDNTDRHSVYSTLNTTDVQAMLSGGLSKFYEKFHHVAKGINVHLPTPEVRFDNLTFSVECPVSSDNTSIGSYLTRALFPFRKRQTIHKIILHPMSGIIKPGTMTLLLGGPSSGKSSLLKALAGKLKGAQGTVLYSGLSQDQLDLNKLVGLVDQTDNHCPTLTVRETFQFADTCLNGLVKNQPEQLRGVAALRTELMLHILGLNNCADTVVGDELLRGVSGGEKKRVTVGEMLVGGQSLFLCDEISTGLDSATTFDIMDSIRVWTKVLGGSAVVALLQPPPEVVELFDDILLISEGRLVYHGPRQSILGHFQSLGFSCPLKIDPADFLVEVVSGRGYQFRNGEVSEKDLPLSTADFEKCFYESDLCKNTYKEISKGYNLPTTYETPEQFRQFKSVANLAHSKGASKFGLSYKDSLELLVRRQSTVFLRDKPLIYGKLAEALLVGLLLGLVYFNADASLYLRMLFFSIAIFQRQAWQQFTISFSLRSIFYKQRSRNFFRTSVYCIADAIVQIPINLAVSIVMGTVFYFMSGLTRSADRYFVFMLVIVAFQHAIGAYFTFLSALAPTMTVAQALGGCSVCFFLLFSGNIILYKLIPNYWIWMYWFDPISWALRSNVLNEFTSSRYTPKQSVTKLSGFQMESFGNEYKFLGVIVLFAYYIVFTFLQAVALHFIRYERKVTVTAEENIDPTKTPSLSHHTSIEISNGKYEQRHDAHNDEHAFIPAYLCIKDLQYWVDNPAGEGELQLLKGVTAYFEPGTMTALMGSTGAGKTTLMDVIAGRKTGGRISGEILVNGIPKNPRTFSRISGYCEQMDIHSYAATVYESLLFSANLRLPANTSNHEKLDIVHDTLQLLELQSLKNNIVGMSPESGLSVEQRKRLTIAVELVSNPSILFLDEPTSGLDARSAQIVMRGVQGIARSGRTIVCTIHQPSVQIFDLFDSLLLLKKGGYVAYFGKIGEDSCEMLNYFASIPGTAKIQPQYNPATYMLEVIGAGIGRNKDGDTDYAEVYANSKLFQDNLHKTLSYSTPQPLFKKFPEYKPISTNFYNQLKVLAIKQQKTYWRTPTYNLTRIIAYPIFGIIFGTTFYKMENKTDKNINSQVGLIYNSMDFIGVISLMTVIEMTCAERAVYYRERMSNYYGALPYSLSLFFAETPYLVFCSMIFIIPLYFLIGLDNSADIFFKFWIAFCLYVALCTYIGQWMSCLMPNSKVANVAVGAISCVLNLLSGYLVPFKFMKRGYKWVSYILPSRYALTALVTNELSHCTASGHEPGCKVIKVTNSTGGVTEKATYKFIKSSFSMDLHHEATSYIVLIAMWAFVQISIYLTLRFVSHLKR